MPGRNCQSGGQGGGWVRKGCLRPLLSWPRRPLSLLPWHMPCHGFGAAAPPVKTWLKPACVKPHPDPLVVTGPPCTLPCVGSAPSRFPLFLIIIALLLLPPLPLCPLSLIQVWDRLQPHSGSVVDRWPSPPSPPPPSHLLPAPLSPSLLRSPTPLQSCEGTREVQLRTAASRSCRGDSVACGSPAA